MSDDLLLTDETAGVATLTLNRPDRLNALSLALESALRDTILGLSRREDIRVIVMTGAGRAFSAGVDLKELEATGTEARTWFGPDSLAGAIRACPIPIIAAVNGFAITGGLELAMLADFIVASDQAQFADTHARVGLTPSWGLTQMLPRRIGLARATQMSLTGAFIPAAQAVSWGLANEMVAGGDLIDRAQQIAREITETDALTAGRIRSLMIKGSGLAMENALALEAEMFREHVKTLRPDDVARNRTAVQSRGRSIQAKT